MFRANESIPVIFIPNRPNVAELPEMLCLSIWWCGGPLLTYPFGIMILLGSIVRMIKHMNQKGGLGWRFISPTFNETIPMRYRRANTPGATYFFTVQALPIFLPSISLIGVVIFLSKILNCFAMQFRKSDSPILSIFLLWSYCLIVYTPFGDCQKAMQISRCDGVWSKLHFHVRFQKRKW